MVWQTLHNNPTLSISEMLEDGRESRKALFDYLAWELFTFTLWKDFAFRLFKERFNAFKKQNMHDYRWCCWNW